VFGASVGLGKQLLMVWGDYLSCEAAKLVPVIAEGLVLGAQQVTSSFFGTAKTLVAGAIEAAACVDDALLSRSGQGERDVLDTPRPTHHRETSPTRFRPPPLTPT
jgi:hypothetical protein